MFFRGFFSLVVMGLALGLSGCVKSMCAEVLAQRESIAKVRGLPISTEPTCRELWPAQLTSELNKLFLRDIPEHRLQSEERVFDLIGFFPKGFSYSKTMLRVYAEQLVGFYDPASNGFVMSMIYRNDPIDRIARHEMAHAAQDERYEIDKLLDYSLTSDELTARSALFEGDANVTMMAGDSLLPCSLQSEDEIWRILARRQTETRSFEVPYSFEMALALPYLFGERFVCTILRQGGLNALSEVYAALPRKSSEILYPETYDKRAPALSTDSEGSSEERKQAQYADTFGVFNVASTFSAALTISEVRALIEDLESDRIFVFNDKNMVWRFRYNSRTAAARALDMITRAVKNSHRDDLKRLVRLHPSNDRIVQFFSSQSE